MPDLKSAIHKTKYWTNSVENCTTRNTSLYSQLRLLRSKASEWNTTIELWLGMILAEEFPWDNYTGIMNGLLFY